MMPVKEKSLYTSFAELLRYPHEDIKLKVEDCINVLTESKGYPSEALDDLNEFKAELDEMPLDDLQGIYSYTFELTVEYTLDLGHHLYDGFKRSNNLASLKAMYREQGFPYEEIAKGEIPDHLPVVLQFLDFTKDEVLKSDLRATLVILAVEKLVKGFERNKGNIYAHLVNAIYKVLNKDVKEVK
jgi:nitrate reductase assembly molybdenum cofactor insertion protein NarJ